MGKSRAGVGGWQRGLPGLSAASPPVLCAVSYQALRKGEEERTSLGPQGQSGYRTVG